MVPESNRKAGPFIGAGQTQFDFDFYMLSADDVVVVLADANDNESTLTKDKYTCYLYADQNTTPGGKVTLKTALASGQKLAICSGVPYTQNLNLTAYGSFNPTSINKEEDRRVIQLQQIVERMRRSLLVPITSVKTPQEVMTELLDVAAKANEYAQQAGNVYQQVLLLRDELNKLVPTLKAALQGEADDQIEEIAQYAQGQIAAILDATSSLLAEQLDRINAAANSAMTINRLLCYEAVQTFGQDYASGTTISLPNGIKYVVGLNHIRLSLNGTILYPEQQYEEVGQTSHLSTQVKLLFPVKANDRLEAWVIPIGGTINEETGEVTPDAGVECNAETWTLDAAVTAGTAITLPNEMKYVAGKKHLRLSWNGILLMPIIDWNETGDTGTESTQIKLNFNLAEGDVLNAWTVPYDHGEPSNTETRLSALEDSLADLSARVVYKEANNGD